MLSPAALLRVLASLLAAELSAGGRARAWDASHWTAQTQFGPAGLGLDSLELVTFASSVGHFFHLYESRIAEPLQTQPNLGEWARVVADALVPCIQRLTFTTSGSTGAPTPCCHALATLREEALFWAALTQGRTRIVQMVPCHHIYGFIFTVVLPELAALPVLDARSLPPGRMAATLEATDLLIGHPAGLQTLLRDLPSLPPGLTVVSSTAPLPAATHGALRARGAEVIEVYGSSETSGVGYRQRPDAPFALLPRWQRDDAGGGVIERAGGAAMPLPDHVEWQDETSFLVVRRRDRAVQVGGVNVYPAHVAERLRGHPLVADCMVRLDTWLPQPRLKAFIVPVAGAAADEVVAACDRWCRETFTAAERPVGFTIGSELPYGAMGKLGDWSDVR